MTTVAEIKLPDRSVRVIDTGFERDAQMQRRFLWQTRSLAVSRTNRGELESKEIAFVQIAAADGQSHEGLYCLDALGAEADAITTGDAELVEKFKDRGSLTVSIRRATPEEVAKWLEENLDPERKALGSILHQSLFRASALENELNVLAENASKEFSDAKSAREATTREKKRNMVLGGALFLFGTVFDIGLWEAKFGFLVDGTDLLSAAALLLTVILGIHFLWPRPKA